MPLMFKIKRTNPNQLSNIFQINYNSTVLRGAFYIGIVIAVLAVFASGGVAAQSADIVVAADGTGDYTSIQSAVDNASDTDRIEVKSGKYEEPIDIRKNISLVAPTGATIANTSTVANNYFSTRFGVQIWDNTNSTISGFTLTNWETGVSAGPSKGSWTARNLTISGSSCSVCAAGTPGDWTLQNVTIKNTDTAVSAYQSTGNWQISNSTIYGDISAQESSGDQLVRNTTIERADEGISIADSTANLTVRSTLMKNLTYMGIKSERSSGNILLSNITVKDADTGVDFENSSVNITIQSSRMKNIVYDGIEFEVAKSSSRLLVQDTSVQTAVNGINGEKSDTQVSIANITVNDTDGDGIDASNATGDWTVQQSVFKQVGDKSIDATDSGGRWKINESILTEGREGGLDAWDANIEINASYNYWNASDGPSEMFEGSGAAVGGNVSVNPFYTDRALTNLATVQAVTAAPFLGIPEDNTYSPNNQFTLGTAHNATGIISDDDVAIRLKNITASNDTVIALNDSNTVPIKGEVNTTVPAGELSDDVTIEVQLINSSDAAVVASKYLNLTAVEGSFVDINASDLPGDGSGSNPYEISNASELQAIEDDLDAHYEVSTDIDAAETATWNTGKGFDPVGSAGDEFTGSFDGNDHTITQIEIDREATEDVGIFGETDERAIIKSVRLESAQVAGKDNVGALVGDLSDRSTVQDVSASVSVTGQNDTGGIAGDVQDGSVIVNSSTTGTVTGSDNVGGLVASTVRGGIVTRSSSSATVTATGQYRGGNNARGGGLVGGNYINSVINQSYATGNVNAGRAGGITGENFNSSRVINTYAAGEVNGNDTVGVGGIVGGNFRNSNVTDSYWDEQSTEQDSSAGDAIGLNTAQMTGIAARTNMSKLEFGKVWQTQPNDYPRLIVDDNDGDDGDGGSSGSTAPALAVPSDDTYDPVYPHTIGTDHNATGVISASDIAIRILNVTGSNSTEVALNGSDVVPVEGDVNTTVPAGALSGNVTVEIQLFNTSSDNAAANATLNLTALSSNSDTTFVDVDASDLPGDGSQSDPYEISNASELQAMEDDLDADYELVNDIDASNTTLWNNENGFAPIGGITALDGTPAFSGSLDGNSYTITELTIDRLDDNRVGLFGRTEGTVSNLSLTGITITGDRYVGGLAGEHAGITTNVTVSGSLTGGQDVGMVAGSNSDKITLATASGTVDGAGVIGGLVGSNQGTITTATASSNVNGDTFGDIGGLVGRNYDRGNITTVTASGTVTGIGAGSDDVGGLVGDNTGIITNAKASGEVNASDNVGGLVGRNDGGGNAAGGTIRETFAVGPVSGESSVGGLVGSNTAFDGSTGRVVNSYFDSGTTGHSGSVSNVTGLSTAEMQGAAARTNMSNLSFGKVWQTQADGYPTLVALTDGSSESFSQLAGEIDTDNDNRIGDFEVLQAIEYWRTNQQVPNTNQTITDQEILTLIDMWETETEVAA